MTITKRFYVALAVLFMATGATVFAAGMKVEGKPAPMSPKPDM